MKKYLVLIEDKNEQDWDDFAAAYKKKGLGKNLSEAILALIKQENLKR